MIERTEKYVSMQKVAMVLDCTERHVYDLVASEELEAIRIGIGKNGAHGRAIRILEKSLEKFIERRKINPKDMFDPDLDKNEQSEQIIEKPVAKSKWMKK